MHRIFSKKQILTLPNLLSLLRLLMIPLILWLYLVRHAYFETVTVLLLSGITDVADGILARATDTVSDFGKILDPIADKCTQGALILCLGIRYPLMNLLIILFLLKETGQAILGLWALKKRDTVNSAKWYGKANTVLLYAVTTLLILFPNLRFGVANGLILLCCAACILSFVLYARFYFRFFKQKDR